ncbi:hypothetical protein D3C71_1932900 [compost metagenome]
MLNHMDQSAFNSNHAFTDNGCIDSMRLLMRQINVVKFADLLSGMCAAVENRVHQRTSGNIDDEIPHRLDLVNGIAFAAEAQHHHVLQ